MGSSCAMEYFSLKDTDGGIVLDETVHNAGVIVIWWYFKECPCYGCTGRRNMVGQGMADVPWEGWEIQVLLAAFFRQGTDDYKVRSLVNADLVFVSAGEVGMFELSGWISRLRRKDVLGQCIAPPLH